MPQELERELVDWLRDMERLVIIGVGNSLRSDDSLGLAIIARLRDKLRGNVCLIDSGTVPEACTTQVVDFNPTHILIVDAIQLDLRPGAARLVKSREIRGIVTSSHTFPLNVTTKYWARLTSARIALLGVQPRCIDFGDELSKEVHSAVVLLSELLLRLLPR